MMNGRRMPRIETRLLLCFALVAITLPSGISGCAHVIAPKTNESHIASYDPQDKGEPTSGIIGIAPGGGRIVTQHYRDRYNSLIDMYGDQFNPPLKHDEGIDFSGEGSTCVIDKAHHVMFGRMLQWKRDGRKPTGTLQRLIRKVT